MAKGGFPRLDPLHPLPLTPGKILVILTVKSPLGEVPPLLSSRAELTAAFPRAATTAQFTSVLPKTGQCSTPWRSLENAHGAQSHLYTESKIVQLIEAESRMLDARGRGRGRRNEEMVVRGTKSQLHKISKL